MRIKALISFVGAVDMNIGEVREVYDERLAASLISCGYAEEVSTEPAEEADEGDNNENIGHNGRGRKKGVKN